MNWQLNKVMIAVILLGLLILSVWLPNALITPVISLNAIAERKPDYQIQDFTVTAMNRQGQPKYRLSAQSLVHYPADNSAALVQPRLTQYTQGEPPIYTTADNGRVFDHGKELLMTGHVKVVRGESKSQPGGDVSTRELRVELD